MKEFKCPNNFTVRTVEDIRTICVPRCGYEEFLECLKRANEEEVDRIILEPSIIYLGFKDLGTA